MNDVCGGFVLYQFFVCQNVVPCRVQGRSGRQRWSSSYMSKLEVLLSLRMWVAYLSHRVGWGSSWACSNNAALVILPTEPSVHLAPWGRQPASPKGHLQSSRLGAWGLWEANKDSICAPENQFILSCSSSLPSHLSAYFRFPQTQKKWP